MAAIISRRIGRVRRAGRALPSLWQSNQLNAADIMVAKTGAAGMWR